MSTQRLFLWRGERRLGWLYLRETETLGSVSAVLVPEDDNAGLESLAQMRHDLFPGAPVTQRPREPDIVAQRHSSRPRALRESPASSTIRDGKPLGVPTHVQYTIRNEVERVLPFASIRVLEVRPIPGRETETLGQLPAHTLHRGSIWCVFASRLISRLRANNDARPP